MRRSRHTRNKGLSPGGDDRSRCGIDLGRRTGSERARWSGATRQRGRCELCLHDGWKTLKTSNGRSFRNLGACVVYALFGADSSARLRCRYGRRRVAAAGLARPSTPRRTTTSTRTSELPAGGDRPGARRRSAPRFTRASVARRSPAVVLLFVTSRRRGGDSTRKLFALLALACVPVLLVSAGAVRAGTPTCNGTKIDPVNTGTYSLPFGSEAGSITITVRQTADGPVFDFQTDASQHLVTTVRVKVVPTIRFCTPPSAASGTGLHSALNPKSGEWYGLSYLCLQTSTSGGGDE